MALTTAAGVLKSPAIDLSLLPRELPEK